MHYTNISLFLLLTLLLFACSEKEPESFEAKVNQLKEQNEHEEALTLLRSADHDPEEVQRLLIEIHLDYGSYLTHEANHLAMSDRMSNALQHFRRVLELDENNVQAKTHVELIEGIYNQMGREIPEGVAK